MSSCCLFFFFQAEDGIRDGHVTGVQTCALPIYDGDVRSAGRLRVAEDGVRAGYGSDGRRRLRLCRVELRQLARSRVLGRAGPAGVDSDLARGRPWGLLDA